MTGGHRTDGGMDKATYRGTSYHSARKYLLQTDEDIIGNEYEEGHHLPHGGSRGWFLSWQYPQTTSYQNEVNSMGDFPCSMACYWIISKIVGYNCM